MKITIFHYHLNPGGVTRIIESQVAAITHNYPNTKLQVITGHCENINYYKKLGVDININEKLNYLPDINYTIADLQLYFNDLYNWVLNLIDNNEILHVHNLNLGKNPVFTLVIQKLLNKGHKVINHAHDFAEDRPSNITFLQKIIGNHFKKNLTSVLYPNNKNYLIGVLNQSDFKRVENYGVQKKRIYLWPNPVFVQKKTAQNKTKAKLRLINTFNIKQNHKIITYPVRVIQRKNIGELILLALLFSDNCTFLVTMQPRNPFEIQYYNNWKKFCVKNRINVIFEAGENEGFETIIAGSDYCITTSRKEGFGMAFLEPWLMETPVIGRNIEYVTNDIKNAGIEFPLLYNKFIVPFYNQIFDFKNLNNDRQQAAILNIINGTLKKEKLFELNGFLSSFPPQISNTTILKNKNTIKQEFSLNKYAEQLFKAYRDTP